MYDFFRKGSAFFICLILLFSVCSFVHAEEGETHVFTDGLGREVSVHLPKSVAVVMGSFAEMWELAGGEIAAVTQDAIDENRISNPDAVAILGSMKSPSVEKIIDLEIDFVILSSNISEHVALKDQLDELGITAAYFDVETFDEYLSVLKIFTQITGRSDLYTTNGTDVQKQIDEAIGRSNAHEDKPTVLFLRAFSTGVRAKDSRSMTGAMLKDLGCINIADRGEELLEDLSMEVIIQEDPDFIFVTTMGSSEEKAVKSLKELVESSPLWGELSAVKQGRYVLLPKELFHLKPNARWAQSYEMLEDILYGE